MSKSPVFYIGQYVRVLTHVVGSDILSRSDIPVGGISYVERYTDYSRGVGYRLAGDNSGRFFTAEQIVAVDLKERLVESVETVVKVDKIKLGTVTMSPQLNVISVDGVDQIAMLRIGRDDHATLGFTEEKLREYAEIFTVYADFLKEQKARNK